MNVTEVLRDGLAHHRAGRIAEAETCYRRVLETDPDQPDALRLLGLIAMQVGKAMEGVALIGRAVEVRPNDPAARFDLGNALEEIGKTQDAIEQLRAATQLKPDFAEAYNNLGMIALKSGDAQRAKIELETAVRLNNSIAPAHFNLGNAVAQLGDRERAIGCFLRAIELQPGYVEAHYNVGAMLEDAGKVEESIAHYEQATQLAPQWASAWNNLGHAQQLARRLDDARSSFARAVELTPGFAEARANLGLVQLKLGEFEQAEESARASLALNDQHAEAHMLLAWVLLLRGDFERGWVENEWRFRQQDAGGMKARTFSEARWNGESLDGRSILLYGEQGLGDTIQFVRYAPTLARRGAKVIVECQPVLKRLLSGSLDGVAVVAAGEVLPAFDVECPLGSVARFFEAMDGTPYLRADETLVRKWKDRIDAESGGAKLKVGIAWAGRAEHRHDRERSMTLETLRPLLEASGVKFFSLQMSGGSASAKPQAAEVGLIDWTHELTDFAETAALMENLDLVISVDTSVAHLAGALGRPVWVMLPFVPDWRWMLKRTDSDWYSTMRLFRQGDRGEWAGVVERVREAIRAWR